MFIRKDYPCMGCSKQISCRIACATWTDWLNGVQGEAECDHNDQWGGCGENHCDTGCSMSEAAPRQYLPEQHRPAVTKAILLARRYPTNPTKVLALSNILDDCLPDAIPLSTYELTSAILEECFLDQGTREYLFVTVAMAVNMMNASRQEAVSSPLASAVDDDPTPVMCDECPVFNGHNCTVSICISSCTPLSGPESDLSGEGVQISPRQLDNAPRNVEASIPV